ncbi:MAG: Rne/Rng family ribonuclease [Deltaproteobacteria bacterium]|jgi:ribonuclease E|nr:Rne/Rng family ribonuclease [Deltaproteobacteria bacterium]MBW2511956.1 Rne/Rng family ribonuclease [Deltaproteobacteria bacterium]
MSKKMLVNATHHEENRVAIVEDGILTELDIEVAGYEPTKGNIYRAVVVRVESGLQAAFVDYGAERLGFLQIDEINYTAVKPDYQPAEDGRRPRISDLLHRGQEILVQITKEERGTKGAALTTYLSLAGRYMVIMPGSQTRGVSRKAESDSQRKELKKAMSSLDMTENVGYIVRTAALNQTREELERDYRYLIRLYESITELNKKVKTSPALLYKESNLIIRSIRDYFTTDMDEVLIDDPEVFKEAKDFFQMVMPDYVKLVKLHQERRPIFSRYQIEEQIETLSRNKVQLPSGGSIVIDPTEALVAIDVNSGKMSSEQGVEATATKTNLEAAKEIGRQLRLRDLGGLVVIDFIDMRDRKHMREVEKEVKKSLENDKARVSVGRISTFGLLEMSRQRLKATLATGSYLPCPHCDGAGRLKSPESQAVSLLRKIHASAAKGQVSRIDAQLPRDVAAYLLNHKREELVTMERDHHLQIHIHGNRDFLADQVEIEIQKKEKDKAPQPEFVAAGLLPSTLEESTEKQAVEPDQEEAPDSSAVPAKKRRRRKRRKVAEGTATEPASEETTAAQAPSDDTGQSKQTGQTAIQTDNAASPLPQEETEEEVRTSANEPAPVAAKKPQRRRRTPSKTKSMVTDSTEQAAPPEHALEQKAPDQTDKNPVQEDKPKRKRVRRAPRKTPSQSEPASTEPEQTTEGQGSDPVQVAAETLTVDASAPEKKAPTRRPRRTAVKKAASATVEQSGAEQADATDQKIVAQAAEEKPKPRRRRPARKKTEPEPATEA